MKVLYSQQFRTLAGDDLIIICGQSNLIFLKLMCVQYTIMKVGTLQLIQL